MKKIIVFLVITLIIPTSFPGFGIMNKTNNEFNEVPKPVIPSGEIIYKNTKNIVDQNLKYNYISRDKIIEIAEAYANYIWYPNVDNIFHGTCPQTGERVDTVDRDYFSGWYDFWGWKAGQLNIGVPYKIGGFSSISGLDLTNPEDFYEQYTGTGVYEGLIHYGGDLYTSKSEPCPRACGVDCSGFVSRCWNLPEKHYTFSEPGYNGLPDVSSPIRYNELKPGDLIDSPNYPIGHAILFKEFVDEDTIIVIEQGAIAFQVVEHFCDITYISDDDFNIRLEGFYYDYTTDYGNQLYSTRQYKFISNTPTTPTIDGPASGRKGREYEYSFVATDPDVDDLYYCVEWGDDEEEFGPYPSGEIVIVKHTWPEEGLYCLRVKAKDETGLESGWEMMSITMPKNKQYSYTSFIEIFKNRSILFQKLFRLL